LCRFLKSKAGLHHGNDSEHLESTTSLFLLQAGHRGLEDRGNDTLRVRFPEDFMFQLTKDEFLRCQFGTSNARGGRRYYPLAFTEQGVAMLSGILNSPRATQVNIAIMRTFVRLRKILATNEALAKRPSDMEEKLLDHDKQFEIVLEAIGQLISPATKSQKRPIGFGRA
jgi:hypothetical protein